MRNYFIFWGLLYIAVLGSSCTAYKYARQTKKDNKIFTAAISNERVAPRLDAYFTSLHPLQKAILIKGKDSIIEVPVIIDRVRDSIIQAQCPTLNLDSLRSTTIVTRFIIRVDTLNVPDSSCERRLQIIQSNLSNQQGKYNQQTLQITDIKSAKNKLMWWLIGVSAALFLVLFLIVYNIIKPKWTYNHKVN